MNILKRIKFNEKKKQKISKRGSNSLNKLSLFQKNDGRFQKNALYQLKMLQ